MQQAFKLSFDLLALNGLAVIFTLFGKTIIVSVVLNDGLDEFETGLRTLIEKSLN